MYCTFGKQLIEKGPRDRNFTNLTPACTASEAQLLSQQKLLSYEELTLVGKKSLT